MIAAARKLQGIWLLALVTVCALLAYPVSLQVASTRSELRRVETEIATTRARIRLVEGEIAVLANLSQLERWNGETFGLVAPVSAQYLPNERALAEVEQLRAPLNAAVRAPVRVALPSAVVGQQATLTSATRAQTSSEEDRGAVDAVRDIARMQDPEAATASRAPREAARPTTQPRASAPRVAVALAATDQR